MGEGTARFIVTCSVLNIQFFMWAKAVRQDTARNTLHLKLTALLLVSLFVQAYLSTQFPSLGLHSVLVTLGTGIMLLDVRRLLKMINSIVLLAVVSFQAASSFGTSSFIVVVVGTLLAFTLVPLLLRSRQSDVLLVESTTTLLPTPVPQTVISVGVSQTTPSLRKVGRNTATYIVLCTTLLIASPCVFILQKPNHFLRTCTILWLLFSMGFIGIANLCAPSCNRTLLAAGLELAPEVVFVLSAFRALTVATAASRSALLAPELLFATLWILFLIPVQILRVEGIHRKALERLLLRCLFVGVLALMAWTLQLFVDVNLSLQDVQQQVLGIALLVAHPYVIYFAFCCRVHDMRTPLRPCQRLAILKLLWLTSLLSSVAAVQGAIFWDTYPPLLLVGVLGTVASVASCYRIAIGAYGSTRTRPMKKTLSIVAPVCAVSPSIVQHPL
eukprot:TRINITY_DN9639_c0_g1_i1.p1 TRINITY_DN9639_c0_g1~~TRINITY_DN9639_c0_g1_i1.p1  ORF type:complete len:488 (-),score=56.28 TRINITY_DN9639_c0_g1_i1:130-1458(-)